MKNLNDSTQLFLLVFLFLVTPLWSASHTAHDHKDYTDCLYETGTGNLNIDQALCTNKGCECYTKIFKNQIEGLKEERTGMIQEKMVDLHTQVVSSILTELTDMNTIYEQAGRSLLSVGSTIPLACSFDSLKRSLSCKSPLAKEMTENIRDVFLEKSDFNYGEKNQLSIETPDQCLTKGEVRGITLHKERTKGLSSIFNKLKSLPKDLIKQLMKEANPLKFISERAGRKESKILRTISKLPILKNLFETKEGVNALFQGIKNNEIREDNLIDALTTSGSLQKALNQNITAKCHQVFKTIDSLACKEISHPYVSNEDFNYNVFGYTQEEPTSDLETHLFACQGKVCLENKTCAPAKSNKLDSNDLLAAIVGKKSISNLETIGKATEGSKYINKRICSLLVCGDKTHGAELFTKSISKPGGTCSPMLNPKRTPMEAYSLLKCPDNEICNLTEMEDFMSYLEYFKKNMVVETQTMMVPVAGKGPGSEGSEIEKKISLVSKKKSPFLQNFMGDVGADIDGFFSTPEEQKQLVMKQKIDEVTSDSSPSQLETKSRGKIFEAQKISPNWNNYGVQDVSNLGQKSSFTATPMGKIRVGAITGLTAREREFENTAKEAIKTAEASISNSNQLQEELKNARVANNNLDQSSTLPTREISSVTSVTSVTNSEGNESDQSSVNTHVSNDEMYTAAPPYTQEDIPTEATNVDISAVNKAEIGKGNSSSDGRIESSTNVPGLEISRKNLTELNKDLLEDFKIESQELFIINVTIGKGSKKKVIPVMVENVPYKGNLILRPIKESHNKLIFSEVLASPLFKNYRTILAIREERKKFFNEILPRIKKI
jgi:hypothetical protein